LRTICGTYWTRNIPQNYLILTGLDQIFGANSRITPLRNFIALARIGDSLLWTDSEICTDNNQFFRFYINTTTLPLELKLVLALLAINGK
jgi:hypothetical protein